MQIDEKSWFIYVLEWKCTKAISHSWTTELRKYPQVGADIDL